MGRNHFFKISCFLLALSGSLSAQAGDGGAADQGGSYTNVGYSESVYGATDNYNQASTGAANAPVSAVTMYSPWNTSQGVWGVPTTTPPSGTWSQNWYSNNTVFDPNSYDKDGFVQARDGSLDDIYGFGSTRPGFWGMPDAGVTITNEGITRNDGSPWNSPPPSSGAPGWYDGRAESWGSGCACF